MSSCFGQTFIGGYNCLGGGQSTSKTYSLPPHYAVAISWDAFYIDSWDGESYIMRVDGTNRYVQAYSQGSSPYNACGGSWSDNYLTVAVASFAHYSTSLTLTFTSTLDQDASDESFGFKNIQITVYNCNAACASCYGAAISQCWSCNNGWYLTGTTCVTDCGAYYWNNPSGNICSRNFLFNFSSYSNQILFPFSLRFNLL